MSKDVFCAKFGDDILNQAIAHGRFLIGWYDLDLWSWPLNFDLNLSTLAQMLNIVCQISWEDRSLSWFLEQSPN